MNQLEVHHHPKVEKKNFKEYFLEFVMIFLAVTLGFIAENIRESISDHSKEKRYIIGIKNDLIADTVSLNDFLPTLITRINQSDTLINFLQASAPTNNGSEMYYLARLTTKLRIHNADNTTLTQLEHSGDFRLIEEQPVVNGLVKLQKIIDAYLSITDLDEHEAEMSYPLLANLFDASVFNTMEKNASQFRIDSSASAFANIAKPEGNPQLRSYNPDAINQLIFYLHERRGSFMGEVGILQEEKRAATNLIQTINAQYHLKAE